MAYTSAWNESAPLGAAQANTIDDIIRSHKVDMRERLAGIFGLTPSEWAADPVVPKTLTLTGALTAASLVGTITTAGQPNVTSLGTLTSLAVTGSVTAGSFVGPLTGNVTGNLTGSVLTAAQTAITSVGTLTSLAVTGAITGASFTGATAGTHTGAVVGNASTATALATARAINGVSFDGTAAITVTAAAGTLTGATLASGVTASSLTSVGTLAGVTINGATSLSGTVTNTSSSAWSIFGPVTISNGQSLTVGNTIISAANIRIGSPTQLAEQANTINFTNDRGIVGANAANNILYPLIKLNTSDQVEIGSNVSSDIKFGRSLITLGGGAAPTLGTIGGSGPATAAQNSWMKFIDSSGAAMYMPVWK